MNIISNNFLWQSSPYNDTSNLFFKEINFSRISESNFQYLKSFRCNLRQKIFVRDANIRISYEYNSPIAPC